MKHHSVLKLCVVLSCAFGPMASADSPEFAWVAGAGGLNDDAAMRVAVGPDGTSYVAGRFQGVATFGAETLTSRGDHDIFLASYDASGTLNWVVQAGGGGYDSPWGIALDATGSIYLTGGITSPAIFGAATYTGNSPYGSAFVAKFDATGQALWVHTAGGFLAAGGAACAVGSDGDLYVAGHYFNSAPFWDGYSLPNVGEYDIFVARITPAGNITWLKHFGTPSYYDFVSGLAVDDNSNVFLGGVLNRYSFIAKFSGAGDQLWLKQTTSYGPWGRLRVAADGVGGVYFADNLIGTADYNGITVTSAGGWDALLGHYDANGQPLWITQFGGPNDVEFQSLALDPDGDLVVAGSFRGEVDVGNSHLTSFGGTDILLGKFDTAGSAKWAVQAGGPGDDLGWDAASANTGTLTAIGSVSSTAVFGLIGLGSIGGTDAFVTVVDEVPSTQTVAIDIKPGSFPNSINNDGNGVIPVAILGSDELDVADIDTSSLQLDGLVLRIRGNKLPQCSIEDVNGDQYPDLVCQFEDEADTWIEGATTATLTGILINGTPIEGSDSISIVP